MRDTAAREIAPGHLRLLTVRTNGPGNLARVAGAAVGHVSAQVYNDLGGIERWRIREVA
jgi:hypothetical protein